MLRRFLTLASIAALCALAPSAPALQDKEVDEREGMEEFEADDPYTAGDPDRVRALGYVRLGHGAWHGDHDTRLLQQTMGGIDMLFVETAHFRIASSLGTYEIPNDREERAKVKREVARLKETLGRVKVPRNELDPWLRLHLYAQRAEDAYAAFRADFDLRDEDLGATRPHMGYPDKIRVVLCQRKSEFGRYVRHYHESTTETAYHNVSPRDSLVVAANYEGLTEGWEDVTDVPYDTMLHNVFVSMLAKTFTDSHDGYDFVSPRWFVYGMCHTHLRRVDPEWTYSDGRKPGQGEQRDQWDWEPRVYSLVKNEYFASMRDMFAWRAYEDLHQRDHMVSWSKTQFLLEELEGDRKAFYLATCRYRTRPSDRDDPNAHAARQEAAFRDHFGLTPEEFDEAWAKWVRKTYRRK